MPSSHRRVAKSKRGSSQLNAILCVALFRLCDFFLLLHCFALNDRMDDLFFFLLLLLRVAKTSATSYESHVCVCVSVQYGK